MIIIVSIVGALAGVYVLVCLFYWFMQERMIFIRFRLPQRYRFRFKPGHPPHEEHFIAHADGARSHALMFIVPEPKGVVLYFHGNAGSLRRWGKRAPRFTRSGWNVLMPDPRGYGKSRGRLSEAALHDDAEAWYRYLMQHWPQERIVVYGRSLGCALAVPLAASHTPRALVLESPFANLYDVARHYSALLPYRLLLRYPFRSDKAIPRVTSPVLIFHGQRDTVVPYASALKLYALVSSEVHREMVTFPKGHHSDLARFPRYRRKLKELLGA
ncbi:MAG: alpha/beta hydrolase [Flavobacteriales bacterium]